MDLKSWEILKDDCWEQITHNVMAEEEIEGFFCAGIETIDIELGEKILAFDFVNMTVKQHGKKTSSKIRRQSSVTSVDVVYEWEEDGKWTPFYVDDSEVLRISSICDRNIIVLHMGPYHTSYRIDLKKMTQVNLNTHYTRMIRRVDTTKSSKKTKSLPSLSSSSSSIKIAPLSNSMSIDSESSCFSPKVTKSTKCKKSKTVFEEDDDQDDKMDINDDDDDDDGEEEEKPTVQKPKKILKVPKTASIKQNKSVPVSSSISTPKIGLYKPSYLSQDSTTEETNFKISSSSSSSSSVKSMEKSTVAENDYSIDENATAEEKITYVLDKAKIVNCSETCSICLDTFSVFDENNINSKLDEESALELPKCKGHCFHRVCIKQQLLMNGKCCICNYFYLPQTGIQPKNGKMTVKTYKPGKFPLSGYEKKGTIEIDYRFSGGIQGSEHPSPGKAYSGTQRTAYLPDTEEGRQVLALLRIAFDRRLTFTVGTSITTGEPNTVVWNGIHHKTSPYGGASNWGYPDETYLDRVKEELKAKGIE